MKNNFSMQDHEMKAKVVIDYIKRKQFIYDPSSSVLLDIAYEYEIANPVVK